MDFTFCNRELPDSVNADEVFKKISDAFVPEPHLLWVPAEELRQSFEAGLSMVVLLDGEPVAHTRVLKLTETDGGWYELGSTWVVRAHRHLKLCHQMYTRFLLLQEDKNVLATTDNVTVLGIGAAFGFVTISRRRLPEEVWRASCTCSAAKMKADDKENCQLAFGERQCGLKPCWFRVTFHTAQRLGLV